MLEDERFARSASIHIGADDLARLAEPLFPAGPQMSEAWARTASALEVVLLLSRSDITGTLANERQLSSTYLLNLPVG